MAVPYNIVSAVTGLTTLKVGAGFVLGISVLVSGSSGAVVGTVFDAAGVSGAVALGPTAFTFPSAAGLVANIPSPPGWYCTTGITVLPASGQIINVMYQ